ncbi:MAG: RecQ family ATP-dependent DNA helicase [Spirochaetia bacterium]
MTSGRASRERANQRGTGPEDIARLLTGGQAFTDIGRRDEIERVARARFGVSYLYPVQRFVISNVLESNPQIVVLPTGAGKSLCFQLPSLLLPGPTLVLMPLLSLLSDQERKLRALGLPVGILKGGLTGEEKSRLWVGLRTGRIKLLLATPESCLAAVNLAALGSCRVSHVVVDEAHCITEWGESFRPSYLQVGSVVRTLGVRMVSAFTATASPAVTERIRTLLFEDGEVRLVGENADRPGISYSVQPVLSLGRSLSRIVQAAEPPLLVFCRTRSDTEVACRSARRRFPGRPVFFYHAGLAREERAAVESWYLASRDGVLFATCAYGMGVDKPDIRTVVHARVPSSVEAYLQESGRAGRDSRASRAILLFDRRTEEAHRVRLIEARSRERFDRILSYAQGRNECRRNVLLSLIGQGLVACSGCDVCDSSAGSPAEGEREIMSFAARHRRRFFPSEAAEILSAARGPRFARGFDDCVPGWGSLAGWKPPEVETAIRSLVAEGRLRLHARGPWKGRLTVRAR